VDAFYRPSPFPEEQGNPLIEALPALRSDQEWFDLLLEYPELTPEDIQRSRRERAYATERLDKFFLPMWRNLELAFAIEDSLRKGYWWRNPMSFHTRSDAERRLQQLEADHLPLVPLPTTSASGFNVIGDPGVGKTSTINRVLSCIPQVTRHVQYQGKPLILKQVNWIRMDCPADGSVGNLARNFFEAVDRAVGQTNYRQFYGGRASRDALINAMARVALNQQVGLLIIDEIQVLTKAKGVWVDQLLNFLVQLRNVIGLPIILVGTPDATPILSTKLRQARRGTGQGEHRWERLAKDYWWDEFVQTLWRFQYTRQTTPFEPAFSDVLYEESQGIPDLAVKVFKLAQKRVILRDENDEVLSVALLREVAREYLGGCQPTLEGIRTGDNSKLGPVPDVFLQTEQPSQASAHEDGSRTEDDKPRRFLLWLRAAGFRGKEALKLAYDAVNELGDDVDQLTVVRWALAQIDPEKSGDKQDSESTAVPAEAAASGRKSRQKRTTRNKKRSAPKDSLEGYVNAKQRGEIRNPAED